MNEKVRAPACLCASAEAIQHHYDVGNEFYRLWLDPTLTYSCALWEEGDTLEQAQLRKLDYHVRQARADSARRVLDIGCGWGSLLKRLVEGYGVECAVGLTLSKAQADWIEKFSDARIDVRGESWADHAPTEPYDAIISIAAFEGFMRPSRTGGERIEGYRYFFSHCHSMLRPVGRLSLQTIAYSNRVGRGLTLVDVSEIFPESDLPLLAEIVEASEPYFEIMRIQNDPHDYERTLGKWTEGLRARKREAIQLVGSEVYERYRRYLHLSRLGFRRRNLSLLRLTFERLDS